MRLTKPETRKVAMQLTSDNKLGYRSSRGGPVSKGSLLRYVLEQKEKHPTKVCIMTWFCVCVRRCYSHWLETGALIYTVRGMCKGSGPNRCTGTLPNQSSSTCLLWQPPTTNTHANTRTHQDTSFPSWVTV